VRLAEVLPRFSLYIPFLCFESGYDMVILVCGPEHLEWKNQRVAGQQRVLRGVHTRDDRL
jgi:hypothetical protein